MFIFLKNFSRNLFMHALIAYINFAKWNIKRKIKKESSNSNGRHIKRILVVRLDEIGDVVLMSPFLRELRRNNPDAEITLIVKPEILSLVDVCPYINKALGFSFTKGYVSFILRVIQARLFCRKMLFRYGLNNFMYDLAIVPRWDMDYGYFAGYVALLSLAKYRVAYASCVNSEKAKCDSVYDRFYTHLLSKTYHLHEVQRNLDLLRFIGYGVGCEKLELWTKKEDDDFVEKYFSSMNKPVIALFLSAGSKRREWSVHKYIFLAKVLQKRYCKADIFILGAGEHAKELGNVMVGKSIGIINLINKLTLRQTAAFLKRADVAVGGDTGPLHMAAAVGCPCVVLSCHPIGADINHANSPARFGIWQADSVTLRPKALPGCEDGCCEDYAHCINNISVKEVMEAIENFLTN